MKPEFCSILQEHIHVALGNEARPAQVEQVLRSAGASRIRISRPSSAMSQQRSSGNQSPMVTNGVKTPLFGGSDGDMSGCGPVGAPTDQVCYVHFPNF